MWCQERLTLKVVFMLALCRNCMMYLENVLDTECVLCFVVWSVLYVC
jgi:hypothetical protein